MNIISVVMGIIKKDGRFLIAKRKKGYAFGGKWEFPGGKVEQEENPGDSLKRELKEELGIDVEVGQLFSESFTEHEGRKYQFLAYKTTYLSGDFILNAHDEIKWVSIEEFDNYDFAPADLPVVEKIKSL